MAEDAKQFKYPFPHKVQPQIKKLESTK